ncbi:MULTISPECIES: histone deacetylase [Corallococcus]|uniref:histone deacetylase family protein n=1 Tax=Corallococcus TaxID=83461 RepID=UPI00117CDF70|nr:MULTISPECIES: histone deacetylase [Corallococcus]NBD07772.1 histone deacetylase [Corallococcus silvisoli]TSC33762.1 histone deacetylase [Corallococcus sp. Z5C101001]
MRVFHLDRYSVPLPEGHRFPMEKYRLLRELLLARGILSPASLFEAPRAERADLERVHTPRYLDAFFGGTLTDAELRRLGFPWSPLLVDNARASVGGTLAAARAALEDGFGAHLAGGTHHAFPDHGEGFCVFNDIAVAIRVLQAEGAIRRAVVVDLDVHQGNGTAATFAGDPSVFTFSMHGEHNFPFRKQPSHLDLGLEDGTGDAEYLATLDAHLPHVLESAHADLLFFQAGVDPLAEDTLGRLSLTHAGLRERDLRVLGAARERGVPVVLTLGGGYSRPLTPSLEAHVGTYLAACSLFR